MLHVDLICLRHSGLLFTMAVQKSSLWIFVGVLHYACEIYLLLYVAGMCSISLMYNILMFGKTTCPLPVLELITFMLLPDWAIMIKTAM